MNRPHRGPAAWATLLIVAIAGACLAGSCLAGCGGGFGATTIEDSEWRPRMRDTVTFPLPQRISLQVGIMGSLPDPNNASLAWLADRTNIDLEFIQLPSGQTGMIEVGIMLRERRMPDLIPDGLLREDDETLEGYFINIGEFRGLTPTFDELLRRDPAFLAGTASRYRHAGGLYSLGSYDAGARPFLGCLAYRQDVFEPRGLEFDTFAHLEDSLATLKKEYPKSRPLGLTPSSVLSVFPSLFRSGYDRRLVAYHNPDTARWTMGPMDPGFRESVEYLAGLYEGGLISPDFLIAKEQDVGVLFANDIAFVAPRITPTGPRFFPRTEEYGGLDEEGEWNGEGVWVSTMPPPATASGIRGWISSTHWSAVGAGFNVYKLSEHPAEAIALLDFLFTPEAGLWSRLGPEDVVWEYEGHEIVLSPRILTPANPDGAISYEDLLKQKELVLGIPLGGLRPATTHLLGRDLLPAYRYFDRYEYQPYFGSGAVITSPAPVLSAEDDFWMDIAGIAVGLQSVIEQRVFEFIMGQAPLEEYDAFVAEVKKLRSDRLIELLNANSRAPSRAEILGTD